MGFSQIDRWKNGLPEQADARRKGEKWITQGTMSFGTRAMECIKY